MTKPDDRDRGWSKPADKPMPPLPQDRPARGNRTVLVLVDSRAQEHGDVAATTLAALHHWGMPYEVWDIAGGALPAGAAVERAAILIAQEHLGRSFSDELTRTVLAALEQGTGVCSIDPWLDEYPQPLRDALSLRTGPQDSRDSLVVRAVDHFVTALRNEGETTPLRKAVAIQSLLGKGADLLADRGGHGVLHVGAFGRGRFVWWGVSPKVWLPETLGHGWGLDDLFWRGLVWAARKPFAMKAMPPLATMRFDDSGGLAGLWWMLGHAAAQKTPFPAELRRIIGLAPGGSASVLRRFEYVNVLNRSGWKPEVSLFVDQVSDEDWAALKVIHDRGGVQVSCHGFSDGYDADGNWRSHFLTQQGLEVRTKDGPRVYHCITPDEFSGESGRYTYSVPRDSIAASMPPYRPAPWPGDVLEANFGRLDAIWARRGITPGRTTNIHWRNPPSNCLAPLKARRQTFSMWTARYNFATVDPEAYAWRMLPYGDAGMCLDYMPIPEDADGIGPTDFFNAQSHLFLRALAYDPISSDVDFFRCRKPPRPGLLTHHDLGLVAESAAHQCRLGLQSLFFACPLTHEMNLATLTAEEWRDVMTDVERRLRRYPKSFVLFDRISEAALAKCETHLERADWNGVALDFTVKGRAATDLTVYVFDDERPDTTARLVTLAPFDGTATLSVRL